MNNDLFISLQFPPFPYYLECGKAVYLRGDQHPNRSHLGVFDLLFVTKGTLYLGEDTRQWNLSSGQTLLLLPDRYHYSVKPCDTDTEFYWVHFQVPGIWSAAEHQHLTMKLDSASKDRLSAQTDAATYHIILPKYWVVPDFKEMNRLMSRLVEMSVESRSFSFWEQHRIFSELLNRMDEGRRAEHTSPTEVLAERTEAYLKQNYQKHLTNELLSEALHFHPNYITRCMKELYQCTPMEYLQKYRLEYAKLLLLKTEWPIANIAEYVGFGSPAYFSSCFVKELGVPPLRFRKRYSK